MQTAYILQAISNSVDKLQETRSEDFDTLSNQLTSMCGYFDSTASTIRSGKIKHALDLVFRIDDQLERAVEVIQQLYRQSAELLSKPLSADNRRSVERLRSVARAAYTAVIELRWEIGEHDIGFNPRKSGYVASSKEDLDQVLDRILSEKNDYSYIHDCELHEGIDKNP